MDARSIAEIEINVLLEAIRLRYDYDFSNYARASLKRRIQNLLLKEKLEMPYQLIPRILYEEEIFNRFLAEMSVTVTELFRDPASFHALAEHVFPRLESYAYFKIWHAGCATGEEVYSLAILLEEAGLLDKARIYATDYNKQSLKTAEHGIFPAADIKQYHHAYKKAGGKKQLAHYYTHQYDAIKFKDSLKKNITFAYHNLVKDGIFGEMHLILCRNVMIYFDRELQNHTFTLFNNSLARKGFLSLGSKETLAYSVIDAEFETCCKSNRIFRKLN
ncbi:MAG: protein-glutamate O-methyltransferase CheR [Pseudomonadales bacterium]|nr:protein-glutamate O-methyltransferase CheR [Pseudomonadales bacterium]